MKKSDLIDALEWIEELADPLVEENPKVLLWKIRNTALEALGKPEIPYPTFL